MIASEVGSLELVQLLLSCGNIDVNIVTSEGKSALVCAASNNHVEIVEILIKAGASVINVNKVNRIKIDGLCNLLSYSLGTVH